MSPDIERDYAADEKKRHRCEVRWLLRERQVRGKGWLVTYLNSKNVESRKAALEMDIKAQWRLGNRGEIGEWYVEH